MSVCQTRRAIIMNIKLKLFTFILLFESAVCFAQTATGELSKGESLFKENNAKDAVEVLEYEILNGSVSNNTYNFLGLGYYQLGEYENSVNAFKRGIKAQPENKKLLSYNLGNTYYAMKDYEAALECYSEAIKEDPSFSEALLNRANALLMIGRLVSAKEDYVEFVTRNIDDPQREKIELFGIDAPIIAWADDPVELFIAQVQGSGRLTTPSGEVIHLGYAGNNGYTFTGIGQILIDEGVDTGTTRSMPAIRDWLQSHPTEAQELMRKNKRYIFFREIQGETPYGTAGVVLTPERSVAVDTTYIPMHTLMFLNTTTPDGAPIQKMVVAQDTGAAIKGGIRADYFWGHGEQAFENAGRMNQAGSYYVLLPKE